MIEPAAAVGTRPVAGAVGPPGVEALLGRDAAAHRIHEVVAAHETAERFDLDRRMGDDLEQGTVVPDVGLERCDVEIAEEHEPRAIAAPGGEILFERGEHLELVPELRIGVGIGEVAAGGNVEVVELDAARQMVDDVPAVRDPAPAALLARRKRQAGDGGDAVVRLLAVGVDVGKAQFGEQVAGEMSVLDLGLLQGEDIRLQPGDEAAKPVAADADRVDVPGGDAQAQRVLLQRKLCGSTSTRSRRPEGSRMPASQQRRKAGRSQAASARTRIRSR